MLGKRSPQGGLFQADTMYMQHVGEDSFHGILGRMGASWFRDEDFEGLYRETHGRPSVPPSQLCIALLLQTHDGVSDDEAIDTTLILGCGGVKDTFNLVSDQIRRCVEEICALKGWTSASVVEEHGLGRHFASSFKGSVELDWSDADEKRALVGQWVGDAKVTLALCREALRGQAARAACAQRLRAAQTLLCSEQPHRSMGNPRFLINFGDRIGLAPSRNVVKMSLPG